MLTEPVSPEMHLAARHLSALLRSFETGADAQFRQETNGCLED